MNTKFRLTYTCPQRHRPIPDGLQRFSVLCGLFQPSENNHQLEPEPFLPALVVLSPRRSRIRKMPIDFILDVYFPPLSPTYLTLYYYFWVSAFPGS